MKITKRQLRKIIKESSQLLNEEEYDYYRDYKAGTITYDEYKQMVKQFQSQQGNFPRYRRKTTFVGSDANKEQIEAVEAALKAKPNNFLKSVLDQLKKGRGLSAKQKSIVRKIFKKVLPDAEALFETKEHVKKKS